LEATAKFPEPSREQKEKSLRSRLRFLKEASDGLNKEIWWRSHGVILANRGEGRHGDIVVTTDASMIDRLHHGFGHGDPAGENATTRHVLGTSPYKIADILDRLFDLYPELARTDDLTVMKKGDICGV
jgi:hypothetical protein